MSDFDEFINRWEITARLNLLTPLRIGGGQTANVYSLSETPVLMSYDAESQTVEPFIPGSSFKGVLRSTVERIVRTFSEEECCISVGSKPCGKCIPCSIFGSMDGGAKIRVLDGHLSQGAKFSNMVDERPHCKTDYELNRNASIYEVEMTERRLSKKRIKMPKTKLRFEEIVASNLSFDVHIKMDNADEHEVGLVLLALDEFNHKRCHIGGGASRGQGFADVTDIKVIKKEMGNSSRISFEVTEKPLDTSPLKRSARDYLKDMDDRKKTTRRDFDVYYNAYLPASEETGNIVFEYNVKTVGEFQMLGADEETVTDGGVPVIPGSTIKGFLRHKLIDDKLPADKIDDLFGAANGKYAHRSRVIISDAYPADEFLESNKIPAGTNLKLWIVFDNMDRDDIELIKSSLNGGYKLITGKRITGAIKNTRTSRNVVMFEPVSKLTFRTKTYLSSIS
jgi:CRISPR-associated protein Csm3